MPVLDTPGRVQITAGQLAELVKVGPHGYIHGWIFVGIPGGGGQVEHPKLGRGHVTGVGNGKVRVQFDNGAEHSFEHRPGPARGGGGGGGGHFEERGKPSQRVPRRALPDGPPPAPARPQRGDQVRVHSGDHAGATGQYLGDDYSSGAAVVSLPDARQVHVRQDYIERAPAVPERKTPDNRVAPHVDPFERHLGFRNEPTPAARRGGEPPKSMPDTGDRDPARPYRVVHADGTSTDHATPGEAARAVGDGDTAYQWEASANHWHRAASYSVTEPPKPTAKPDLSATVARMAAEAKDGPAVTSRLRAMKPSLRGQFVAALTPGQLADANLEFQRMARRGERVPAAAQRLIQQAMQQKSLTVALGGGRQ